MRVEFHIPKETLEVALKHYDVVKDSYYNKGLSELMETIRLIVETGKAPTPNPPWPVSYEDACDVVAVLHRQIDERDEQIIELERQLHEMSKSTQRHVQEGGVR